MMPLILIGVLWIALGFVWLLVSDVWRGYRPRFATILYLIGIGIILAGGAITIYGLTE